MRKSYSYETEKNKAMVEAEVPVRASVKKRTPLAGLASRRGSKLRRSIFSKLGEERKMRWMILQNQEERGNVNGGSSKKLTEERKN
jgi:hypothetical protein